MYRTVFAPACFLPKGASTALATGQKLCEACLYVCTVKGTREVLGFSCTHASTSDTLLQCEFYLVMQCERYGEIKLVQRASLSVCMRSNVEAAASLKININDNFERNSRLRAELRNLRSGGRVSSQ